MGYNMGKTSPELWAVLDMSGNVVWTRGGSSTSPRLMVYESEAAAEKVVKNHWTKQAHDESDLRIVKVYPTEADSISLLQTKNRELAALLDSTSSGIFAIANSLSDWLQED